MTKTTCDICGNLITDSRENWLVSIQSHVGERALKYYQENYETAVNIFLNDQNQVNILIKTYNETSTSPLEEFQSKKITEYIDYNQDGNYLEREEL